jgi:hypothetical protein
VRVIPLDLRGTFDGYSLSMTRDGRTLYMVARELEADLWLLDIGGPQAGG